MKNSAKSKPKAAAQTTGTSKKSESSKLRSRGQKDSIKSKPKTAAKSTQASKTETETRKRCKPRGPGKAARMNRKQRRELARKIQADDISLQVIHPDAAGIDIGNQSHYVAVPPSRDSEPVRSFGWVTGELEEMAAWLKGCKIRTVAMQSTGVYWIPVYDVLEAAGLEVYLVNARDTKNLPGKKTDVEESQWLMKLHTYGLLRNSFRPSEQIGEIANLLAAAQRLGAERGTACTPNAESTDPDEHPTGQCD